MRYDCGDGLLFVMASAALVATNTASLGEWRGILAAVSRRRASVCLRR